MAEILFTKAGNSPDYQVYNWDGVSEGDTFNAAQVVRTPYSVTMQATGTFGGATIELHGSVDGTNYAALNDLSGTAIGLTAAGIASIGDAVLYIKPVISGGTSSDVDVHVIARFDGK
jgi:hypothetical protein